MCKVRPQTIVFDDTINVKKPQQQFALDEGDFKTTQLVTQNMLWKAKEAFEPIINQPLDL